MKNQSFFFFIKEYDPYLMHSRQDVVLFFLGHDPVMLRGGSVVNVFGVEPRLEDPKVVEDLRHEEIEKGPQF